MEPILDPLFARAKYPKEDNRFVIAMAVGIPVTVIALILTLVSLGLILLYVGLTVFIVWISLSIAKMSLIGNSVRVSKDNFPEILEVYQEVKTKLNYNQNVPIYVVNEGEVNALLAKFFRTRFIVLNSELVKDMVGQPQKRAQMTWVISRFIGSLRAKHFRAQLLKVIFETIEKIKVFNLFLLPYERATQYTGDNIGMLVTGNVDASITALNKLLIGNDLAKDVAFRGIINQGVDLDQSPVFSFLARSFSSHPHLVNRYLNLLAFANKEFPEQFNKYLDNFDNQTKHMLFSVLPRY